MEILRKVFERICHGIVAALVARGDSNKAIKTFPVSGRSENAASKSISCAVVLSKMSLCSVSLRITSILQAGLLRWYCDLEGGGR